MGRFVLDEQILGQACVVMSAGVCLYNIHTYI